MTPAEIEQAARAQYWIIGSRVGWPAIILACVAITCACIKYLTDGKDKP